MLIRRVAQALALNPIPSFMLSPRTRALSHLWVCATRLAEQRADPEGLFHITATLVKSLDWGGGLEHSAFVAFGVTVGVMLYRAELLRSSSESLSNSFQREGITLCNSKWYQLVPLLWYLWGLGGADQLQSSEISSPFVPQRQKSASL